MSAGGYSPLRRWLRAERARDAEDAFESDLQVRRWFAGCTCKRRPCFRFPCVSLQGDPPVLVDPATYAALTDGAPLPPPPTEFYDGKFFETDHPLLGCDPPVTFSNVPDGPLTAEHLKALAADVRAMAGKPLPAEAFEPTVVMPPWVLKMAVDEGWVDERGRFTEKYWRDFRELNKRP